jgi:hypothetical protein
MLLALQVPASDPDLTAGTHGPTFVDAEAQPSIGGPFSVQWDVVDGVPSAGSKKITVTVIHALEESARARLVTYLKIS